MAVTVVIPGEKVEPDGGEKVTTVTPEQLSDTVAV